MYQMTEYIIPASNDLTQHMYQKTKHLTHVSEDSTHVS